LYYIADKHGSYRLCEFDIFRGQHGVGDVLLGCEALADGMRAVDMEVGHFCAVPHRSWAVRQQASDAECWSISGQCDAIRIDRGELDERSEKAESRGDRVVERDSAGGESGAGIAHCCFKVRGDDMRADDMAVGYIGGVPAWAQHVGQPACIGDDGAAGRRKLDGRQLYGAERGERV
jgi:hypothetical protein